MAKEGFGWEAGSLSCQKYDSIRSPGNLASQSVQLTRWKLARNDIDVRGERPRQRQISSASKRKGILALETVALTLGADNKLRLK